MIRKDDVRIKGFRSYFILVQYNLYGIASYRLTRLWVNTIADVELNKPVGKWVIKETKSKSWTLIIQKKRNKSGTMTGVSTGTIFVQHIHIRRSKNGWYKTVFMCRWHGSNATSVNTTMITIKIQRALNRIHDWSLKGKNAINAQ